ncbi:hypothetical protein [Dinghuibacter silviterrae]|uniref:MG2 domain-containing protein n=1 Tax=Dinghuibacter silviterrae TaxID=1539049 RepID=A0A4R8DQI7_9BACT|nr:hypothetical protein [Dinghuibacter silviterrae]TDX00412.1 hypothetical protein EDB95_1436 [Dinghuibacter silviterrae]
MNRAYLFVLLTLAGAFKVSAQQQLSVDSLFRILPDSFPAERLYLHLDKDRYMTGDTVWFKAYFSSGGFPGGFSTGVHVELFNEAGVRVTHKYYPVLGGKVSLGDMELADTLGQGLYTLRAYSDWMSNFDPAFFYHHTFPVYASTVTPPKGRGTKGKDATARPQGGRAAADPGRNAGAGGAAVAASTGAGQPATAQDERVTAPAVDIQFLPEGGDEVQGVLNTIAFRATDRHGLPVDVSGKVVDDVDSTYAIFSAMHDGMGILELIPEKGKHYTAVVQTPLGEKRIALPEPRPDGVVLNTRTTSRGVGFVLRADSASRYLDRPLQVVASLYGQLCFRAKTTLSASNTEISGFIPTDKFVPGIMTLTLFADNGEPLAERVVFIRPTDVRIQATLHADTLSMDPKGYNAWTLQFTDTARCYLSVSVTDADAVTPAENGPNILTGLLLSGDLKGNIYQPAFYFRDDADSTQAMLDLVMRTHGWRRYDWGALETRRFPQIQYQDRNYLSFQGQALTESGRKVVSNTLLTIFLRGSDSTKRLMLAPVDSAGQFTLDGLVFFDTAQAYYQVNKKGWRGTDVQLRLRPDPFFPLGPDVRKGIVFPESGEDTAFVGQGNREADLVAGLRRLQKAKELQEIVIHGRKKTPLEELDERYASGLFSGGEGHNFDLVNDNNMAQSYFDILSFLQGRVAGLQISGAYPNLSAHYRGGTPAFFVDEMNTDENMLESIPVADIAYVKVFEPPFVGATGGGPYGAIAIYTRRGGDQTYNVPGLKRLTLAGYAPIRTFYAPVYDAADTAARAFPDYRTTLDWAPYLFSSARNLQVPVRFYNNDACTRFRIIAEGMDEEGRLLHLEQVVGKKQ